MRFITSISALAALAPVALADPQAYIKNNCPYDVYLWAVDIVRKPTTPLVIKAGGSYSEPYHQLSSGGVSLKLSKDQSCQTPTQFEYTVAGGFIWYDGSNVDCRGSACPFYADGIYLEASDPSCPTRTCKPNQDCTGFYINFNDDINTLSCNPKASVSMYLCSQSATGGSAAPAIAAGSAGQASAPVAAAVSSSAPQAAVSSVAPKYQMEAVHGPASSYRQQKRHIHHHKRRHSHQ